MPRKPRLGLVCMTASDEIRFRTITRTRLHALPAAEQRTTLLELYRHNAERLAAGFRFCKARRISLFRMSSDLFPFADTPAGEALLRGLADELGRLGEVEAQGLRLVMHPDQYVVLNSERPEVVSNAERVLVMHGLILDLLRQPRSPYAAINIHGGKGGRRAELASRLRDLPDGVRERMTLENDERAYGAADILWTCEQTGVPMVFDAHHHVIHEELDSYDDESVAATLRAARDTWPDKSWQMVHISNGRESFRDMRHSDLITTMPACYRAAPWIEIEAKSKELAIDHLRELGW